MARGRKVFFWGLSALIIVSIAVAVFFFFRFFRIQSIPVMQAVPDQTVVLVKPMELKKLPYSLEDKESMLNSLSRVPLTKDYVKSLLRLDALFKTEDKFREVVAGNQLLLAWVPDGESTFEMLILLELENLLDVRVIRSFIANHFSVTPEFTTQKGRKVYRIDGNDPYYYCISNGIFTGSRNIRVLEMAIDKMESKSGSFSDPEFQKIINTSGVNVQANIYVQIPELIRSTGTGQPGGNPPVAGYLGDFASLDLLVKENGLLMNGFFTTKVGVSGFPDLFKDHEVVASDCPAILPVYTTEFFKLGFTRFDSLCCALARLKNQNVMTEEILPVSEFEKRHFMNWTDHEVTIARTGTNRQVALFMIRQDTDALAELAGITGKTEMKPYMEIPVFSVSREGMIRDLLWPFSGELTMPFYCKLDEYIVFGSSEDALQQVIRNYSIGNTLVNGRQYRAISAGVTENSHLYYYADLEKLLGEQENFSHSGIGASIVSEDESYRHFPAFTAQFTLSGKWLYASMALAYEDTITEEGTFLWMTRLEDKIKKGPYLVTDTAGRPPLIMAADQQNFLYVISPAGTIICKKALSGPLLGNITELQNNVPGNLYLFNTPDHLYMIDAAGQDAEGFPVSLAAKAVTGLKMVKFDGMDLECILIPGQDKKIYSYTLSGQLADAWNMPELPAAPSSVPFYLSAAGKDYLIFTDMEGNILITDPKGKSRMQYQRDITDPANSGFFLNRTNSRGLFITTDKKGHLIYLPEKGRIQETIFSDFSPEHYFFYSDIDGNSSEDFVYFDHLKMLVFDRFKKKLIEIELPEEPAYKPLIIELESKRKSFFYPGKSGIVYVVDHLGNIHSDDAMTSDSELSAWQDQKSGMIYILASKGRKVCLYPLYLE